MSSCGASFISSLSQPIIEVLNSEIAVVPFIMSGLCAHCSSSVCGLHGFGSGPNCCTEVGKLT